MNVKSADRLAIVFRRAVSEEHGSKHNGSSSKNEGGGALVDDSAVVQRHNLSVVSLTGSEVGVALVDAVKELHDGLADGHGLSEDGPLDSLGARRSGERSVVTPEIGSVKSLDQVSDGHSAFILKLKRSLSLPGSSFESLRDLHLSEESLSDLQGRFAGFDFLLSNDLGAVRLLEEHSQNGVGSLDLRVGFTSGEVNGSLLLELNHSLSGGSVGLLNDVHLKGHVFAVNLMFGRSMEVEL